MGGRHGSAKLSWSTACLTSSRFYQTAVCNDSEGKKTSTILSLPDKMSAMRRYMGRNATSAVLVRTSKHLCLALLDFLAVSAAQYTQYISIPFMPCSSCCLCPLRQALCIVFVKSSFCEHLVPFCFFSACPTILQPAGLSSCAHWQTQPGPWPSVLGGAILA